MKRSIEQWRNCDPSLMAVQSEAAVTFALRDAQADIIALHDALRDMVRIAKAASIGVTGNAKRIARAEAALNAEPQS